MGAPDNRRLRREVLFLVVVVVGVVKGKQWKCGSGGVGRKIIEILKEANMGGRKMMVIEIATILEKSLRKSIHNFSIHDSIHNVL